MAYTNMPNLVTGDPITAANWTAWIDGNFDAAPAALATAKGVLFPASGSGAAVALPVGSDGQIVETDSAQTSGMKNSWGYVPVGGVIMWAGTAGTWPSNWALCDGTGGTPNLRDRFIIGAGSTYAVNATGGANTQNIQHTHTTDTDATAGSHTHTQGNTNAGGSHTHQVRTTNASPGANNMATGAAGYTTTHYHTKTSGGEATHVHARGTNNAGSPDTHGHTLSGYANQLSTTQDTRPPYFALAFIRRMS